MAKSIFETQTCSRCHGCGEYSYCEMYGSTCFKCGGSGLTLTKRGEKAQWFFRKSISVESSSLEKGQQVYLNYKWRKITGMKKLDCHVVVKMGNYSYQCNLEHTIMVWADNRKDKINLAIVYQDTLTKKGTIRKKKENEDAKKD